MNFEKKEDKTNGDNEDSESMEEQPLDVGEHYLVRMKSDDWCKSLLIYISM